MSYGYNLAGALTDETYPSGRIVHHNYAPEGKLTGVSSRIAANRPFKSYAQNFSYNAAGAVTEMQLGNMRWESTQFNSRMQPVQIALGTTQTGANATDLLQLNYAYDDGTNLDRNNGNVISQTISVRDVGTTPGFVANQSYVYDELNRLKSAKEISTPNGGTTAPSWKQTYIYGRFGNWHLASDLDFLETATWLSPSTKIDRRTRPSWNGFGVVTASAPAPFSRSPRVIGRWS